jgi:hypothetical protein
MPQRNFICERCGWKTTQFGNAAAHPCPRNGGALTDLILVDTTSAIDICCDGCDAERLGEEHHAYSTKAAKDSARAAGWECDRKSDWCPRCVAERKHVMQ